MQESDISNKVTSVKVNFKMSAEMEGILSLENGIAGDQGVHIILVVDAQFGPWGEWSPCTKQCLGEDNKYGN